MDKGNTGAARRKPKALNRSGPCSSEGSEYLPLHEPQALHRYAKEFVGRYNHKSNGQLEHMARIVQGIEGQRLTHLELTGALYVAVPTEAHAGIIDERRPQGLFGC